MLRPSLIIWRMAGTPAAVAGIFTMRLGRLIVLVQLAGGQHGGVGVVGDVGGDLDADEAVAAARRLVQRREHVEGAVDVLQHHGPVVVDDRRRPPR